MDQLEVYAEHAHSSIFYLLLEAANIQDDTSLYTASHVGVSFGLVTYLRALPYEILKVILLYWTVGL